MNKNLLIIGFVWPEPETTAAGTRMLQLIDLFQKLDYKITFCSTALQTDNSFPLESLGIESISIQLNDTSFDTLLRKINPNTILFDRFITEEQFGWRVEETCPNAIRILDTEDLHFLRKTRENRGLNKEFSLEDFTNDHTKREIASIYRCDLTLLISTFEFNLLAHVFNIDTSLLFYIPFVYDALQPKDYNGDLNFEERKDFMTIGNFKHEPNWNGILYLKSTIWPLIRKELPNTKLHIYGAYAPEKAKQLHNDEEGFLIEGWAEDKKEVFQKARVCLAPLQFGAGLKGKLIDSMLYGTPNVTTNIGAEGMHNSLPWNGFIEDNPVEFANKSATLYNTKEIWNQAQKDGYNILKECFSKEKFTILFFKKFLYIEENLKKHRSQNFIGAMLLHHSLKSTKYLSKWIEEKNK